MCSHLKTDLSGCLSLLIILTPLVTQALPPPGAPSQTFLKVGETTPRNGTAVPGDSPIKYYNDPGHNLFLIESIDMHPNPCVLESYCAVILHGTFTESLIHTTPHVSFNVTSRLADGREGLVPGEDDLCNWVDIVQESSSDIFAQPYDTENLLPALSNPSPYQSKRNLGKRKDVHSCPPKKGKAKISSRILLLGGYVPEANFTVKVRATEKGTRGGDSKGGGRGGEGRTIFDLWTSFELKYKDGMVTLGK